MTRTQIRKLNSKLFILCRESRGLTQSELALGVGVKQAAISQIENGLVHPSPGLLFRISELLSYPMEIFYSNAIVYSPDPIYYRKRASLSNKHRAVIDASLHIKRIRIQNLLNSIELGRNFTFMDPTEFDGPENIARTIRSLWKLPKGPIENLTSTIEKAGIIIININENNEKFDGMAFLTESGQPIIYNNSDKPWDRQRFNLAHELGHLIMHLGNGISVKNAEDEANRFASELLLPELEIKPYLTERIDIGKLLELKRYWKASMAAIIRKGFDIGQISESRYTSLNIQLSSKGYKRSEPDLGIPVEQPLLLNKILETFIHKLHYSKEQLAELLFMNSIEEVEQFTNQQHQRKLKVAI